ncbi:MAG: DUF559 domain-containing protein [Candidatus Lambdaproteobacteria bacterium]|nr:DUF559 domain-containing protein [Candidatus Lambdaproteobacteria bacterium]
MDVFGSDAKRVIDVDGAVHDSTTEHDTARQEQLERMGFRILRFRNPEMLTALDAAMTRIERALAERSHVPSRR